MKPMRRPLDALSERQEISVVLAAFREGRIVGLAGLAPGLGWRWARTPKGVAALAFEGQTLIYGVC
jgi:hypothetical protein